MVGVFIRAAAATGLLGMAGVIIRATITTALREVEMKLIGGGALWSRTTVRQVGAPESQGCIKQRVPARALGRPGAPPRPTPICATPPTPRESDLEEQVYVCFGKHSSMREQGEVPARAGDNGVKDEDALNGAEPKLGCMSLV